MKTVPLHGKKAAGRVALVDDADYELVMAYRWRVIEEARPGRTRGPYVITTAGHGSKNRVTLSMHKLITGWPLTDHKDHDGLNNQRSNLRPATGSQNSGNQRAQNGRTSKYKGVSMCSQTKKWLAQISVQGRGTNLGRFAAEEDAARAYDAAARIAWGEFACTNFPD